jgi:hypothetical protein
MLDKKYLLESFFLKLKEDIIKEQESQDRTASGKAKQGYETEINDTDGTLYGVDYVFTLETGRKGGAVPTGFRDIILKWMESKSLFSNEKLSKQKSIAYFIAKKIQESGTKLHREGATSGILSKFINDNSISEFSKKLQVFLEQEVEEAFEGIKQFPK